MTIDMKDYGEPQARASIKTIGKPSYLLDKSRNTWRLINICMDFQHTL